MLMILGQAHLHFPVVEEATLIFFLPQAIPILTDVWVYDTASNDRLEQYIRQIFSYITKYEIDIPKETCLVLEFRNSGDCGYYFVNHAKQCLFWLDEFDGMGFLGEVKVKYTPSHIGGSPITLQA